MTLMLIAVLIIQFICLALVVWSRQSSMQRLSNELDRRFGETDQALREEMALQSQEQMTKAISEHMGQQLVSFKDQVHQINLTAQKQLVESMNTVSHQAQERQENSVHRLQIQLSDTLGQLQKKVSDNLDATTQSLAKQFQGLNETTERRLSQVGEKVEQRLTQGFEKTSQTFTDVVKRLALIDDAQKKIHDLSSNVVTLQEILQDKRSRGVFGEIQLKHLLENALPDNAFALQHTLSNGTRVDSMLFLPEPTGHIAIDSKFPLDSFKTYTDVTLSDEVRSKAQSQFKLDIKKHIKDIADKYIIPGQTADGAIMFIPAEAVFADIHAHHPDLVETSHQSKVWMTSPTTMMAILTTASAVLKDSATRQQVHLIQKHLKDLSKDFARFEQRMDNLAKHLKQANQDADLINTSAKKITSRFTKIENVELEDESDTELLP